MVCIADNELGITRLGASSTTRLGNAAERNRAKRLVREAFRLSKDKLPHSADIVVLPKIPWQNPSLEELKIELPDTARRAKAELARRV